MEIPMLSSGKYNKNDKANSVKPTKASAVRSAGQAGANTNTADSPSPGVGVGQDSANTIADSNALPQANIPRLKSGVRLGVADGGGSAAAEAITTSGMLAIELNKKENADAASSYNKQYSELRSSKAVTARQFRVKLEDPAIVKRFALALLKNDTENVLQDITKDIELTGQARIGADYLNDSVKIYDQIYRQIDKHVPELQKTKYMASLDKAFLEHNNRHAYSGSSQTLGKAIAEHYSNSVNEFSEAFISAYASKGQADAFAFAATKLSPVSVQ